MKVEENKGDLQVDIRTFNPDYDDDGQTRDYGWTILEGASVVGDGTLKGFDRARINRFLSLLEHAPDLHDTLDRLVREIETGDARMKRTIVQAKDTIRRVQQGTLKYGER